jgi:glycosyltransferase involved in cell wall biosynthesis
MSLNNNLSIGIALFRDDRSANFAVNSALVQSDKCDEIVISDNNPNRSSNAIRDWLKDSRVKYINTDGNIGMYQNFIRAYDNSTNRYFCWLSDDDFLHPMLADAILHEIPNNKDENIVAWSGISTIHSTNHCSRLSGRVYPSFTSTNPIQRLKDVAYFGQWNFPFYSIIDKSKISIETLRRFCEWPAPIDGIDWAWSYALALRGKIKIIPEQIYFYNISNWQNSNSTNRQLINFTKAVRSEFHTNELLIDELTKINRSLLYMAFTFYDYIEYTDQNKNAYDQKHVSDLIKLWCHNVIDDVVNITPSTLVLQRRCQVFLKSGNLRDYMFNLADFYDYYLEDPMVSEFFRKIFSNEQCADHMQILSRPVKKMKKQSYSVKKNQTNFIKLGVYLLIHFIRDKLIFLPQANK